MVWEDPDESEVDNPAVPSDPYDEIVPADWEALFGGDNDDDNDDYTSDTEE